jgi:hypothetical protein
MRTPTADSICCTKPGCKGILFNVTPLLAYALGQKHVRCDQCGTRWCIQVKPEDQRRLVRRKLVTA